MTPPPGGRMLERTRRRRFGGSIVAWCCGRRDSLSPSLQPRVKAWSCRPDALGFKSPSKPHQPLWGTSETNRKVTSVKGAPTAWEAATLPVPAKDLRAAPGSRGSWQLPCQRMLCPGAGTSPWRLWAGEQQRTPVVGTSPETPRGLALTLVGYPLGWRGHCPGRQAWWPAPWPL